MRGQKNIFSYIHMSFKKNAILKGALALAAGTFIAKILGALYRIPLTNLLGGEGLGLYQTVFPVYCVLLDFAGAGVPSALSKIISSYTGEEKEKYASDILKSSLILFAAIGFTGTLSMFFFSRPLAVLQGNADAWLGYVFLSPAVVLVALLSCYRGYFQAKMNMAPTAVSQIAEQAVKLAAGLFFAYVFMPNVPLAVGGATLAVSISELAALLYLLITFRVKRASGAEFYPYDRALFRSQASTVIKFTVPVTLVGIAIPFSQVIDSFIVVNLLKAYRSDATTLYGLFSGAANTVINLPVALCYGIAAVAIPAVAGAKNRESGDRNAVKTLLMTLAVSLPFALIVAATSKPAVNVLFGSLPQSEKDVTVNLLRIMSVNVVFLSFLQTENAVLIGKNKPYFPVLSLGIGIAVKTALQIALLPIGRINIYGSAIASIACYFTAGLINLFLITGTRIKNADKRADNRECAG